MRTPRRFRHSLAFWCLHNTQWGWNLDQIADLAHQLVVEGLELVPPELLPALAKKGLKGSLGVNGMPDPPFVKGLNNQRYQEEVIARTKESIERCADFAVPNVIAFTGYKWRDAERPENGELSPEEGARHCIAGLKELAPYAARHHITLCLEHLNSRDGSHPMKGHPGYQGDNVDYCADIVRQVNSPSVKLLFDFYHVQIMHGDVIRRFRQHADVIGHTHTAGNPGRNALDDAQEIHYPGIARALSDLNFRGFIGHEFIPLGDPLQSFEQAISLFENA